MIDDLIKEHERRVQERLPVYFTFEDSIGSMVKGWTNPDAQLDTAEFQKALLRLSDSEFETLSARTLQLIGCTDYWATPQSHDQGIDAFGHFPLLPDVAVDFGSPRRPFLCWILVQAKHYEKSKINSATIREFVGSAVLARHQTYAQESTKYSALDLQAVTPIGLVITTSGEVKRTARVLVEGSDVFILTSNDLCAIFTKHWKDTKDELPSSSDDITSSLKQETLDVPVAR